MEFLVIGYDGKDENAMARRLAVRQNHLGVFDRLAAEGVFKYGAAILDEKGNMAGSVIICNFESREQLEETWLKDEPYVTGDVWRKIEINELKPRINSINK